jgi:hypothetical protein
MNVYRAGCFPLLLLAAALLTSCGRDDRKKSAEARPRLHYCEYGMTIFFGLGGDSERIRIRGWSHTEPHFTWTDGDSAALGVRLLPSKHPIQLRFKMAGMTAPPRVPFQRVEVHVNSEKLATWEVGHEDVFTLLVPAKFVRAPKRAPGAPRPFVLEPGTRLLIEFSIPDAISPLELGQSGDPRRLGLRVAELHISNDPPPGVAERRE